VHESDNDIHLLTRHLSGSSTPEEEESLREWLAADPANQRLLDRLYAAWSRSAIVPAGRYDLDAAWGRISRRLAAAEPGSARARPRARGGAGSGWLASRLTAVRAAALVLLVAGAGALWTAYRVTPRTESTASLEITVPNGQEAEVRLPDGSRVMLAPESTLRYPRTFGEHSRELQLEGMGYFEVVHDADRPFLVHAGTGVARVLGTRFVVRAYPDAPRVEVAVTQGAVSLRSSSAPANRALAITPGQVGRLDGDGVARLESRGAAELYLGWMSGQPLVLDLPLTEALAEIERWYDVNLAVGDTVLASRRITTPINRSSLTETLAVVALALDATYVRSGDTLVFLRNPHIDPSHTALLPPTSRSAP
jgi:ferric-dicitrate binding protein FerR (iron transport regulator)